MSTLILKKQIKDLINGLEDKKAYFSQLLEQLEEIRVLSLEGVEQEKVWVKEGSTAVTERYPQVALQAVMGKLQVVKELIRLDSMDIPDPEINISFAVNITDDVDVLKGA